MRLQVRETSTTVSVLMSRLAVLSDKEDVEYEVRTLPAEQVVGLLHAVTETRRQLYEAEKLLKIRIAAEQLLSSGEQWTAPDGSDYVWTGDRERVCDDPAMLKSELEQVALSPVARIALKEAFKDQPMKTYFSQLDRIEKWGGPEAGKVIRSHVSWKESAPKLRSLDADGR